MERDNGDNLAAHTLSHHTSTTPYTYASYHASLASSPTYTRIRSVSHVRNVAPCAQRALASCSAASRAPKRLEDNLPPNPSYALRRAQHVFRGGFVRVGASESSPPPPPTWRQGQRASSSVKRACRQAAAPACAASLLDHRCPVEPGPPPCLSYLVL